MTSTAIVLYQAAPVAVIASPMKKPKAEVDIFVAWLKANKFATEERKVIKVLEGLSGSKNIWKESPQVKVKKVKKVKKKAKKVTKPLVGLAGCKNIWKESPAPRKTGLTTCSACGVKGHNSRTCSFACQPCRDQTARSTCFAGLSATKATTLATILEDME